MLGRRVLRRNDCLPYQSPTLHFLLNLCRELQIVSSPLKQRVASGGISRRWSPLHIPKQREGLPNNARDITPLTWDLRLALDRFRVSLYIPFRLVIFVLVVAPTIIITIKLPITSAFFSVHRIPSARLRQL